MIEAYPAHGTPGGAATATAVVLTLVWIAFAAGVYVWTALALTAVFRKAGLPAWRAWVPVVNSWTLFALAGMRGWWAVVLLAGAAVLPLVQTLLFAVLLVGAVHAGAGSDDPGTAIGLFVAALILVIALYVAYVVLALVLQIRMLDGVGRRFRLNAGYTVLGVFLFPVWASVVGWGPARWIGPRPSGPAGPAWTSYPPVPPRPPIPYPPAAGPGASPAVPPRPAPPTSVPQPVPESVPGAPPPYVPSSPAFSGPASPAPPARPYAPTSFAPFIPAPAPVSDPAAPTTAAPVAERAHREEASPSAPPPSVAAFAPADGPSTDDHGSEAEAPYGPRRSGNPAPEDDTGALDPWDPASAGVVPVSAFGRAHPVVPWDEAGARPEESTAAGDRRRPGASLSLPDGTAIALTAEHALLGRNPVPRPDAPRAQLVAIADATRTISKTHALLTRTPSGWRITDLDSTNGVAVVDAAGAEHDVTGPTPVTERFFLGDAELRLRTE